jgi:outer membrane protein TolC
MITPTTADKEHPARRTKTPDKVIRGTDLAQTRHRYSPTATDRIAIPAPSRVVIPAPSRVVIPVMFSAFAVVMMLIGGAQAADPPRPLPGPAPNRQATGVAANKGAVAASGSDIAQMLKGAGGDRLGARARLRNLPIREVNADLIARAVLNNNLDVLNSIEAQTAAGARVDQRAAAFDPTVFFNSSYTHADSRGRFTTIGRLRNTDPYSQAQKTADAEGDVLDDTKNSGICSVTIDGEGTVSLSGNTFEDETGSSQSSSCFAQPVYSEETEFASGGGRARQTLTNTVGVSKRFGFGGQTSVSVTSTWRKKFSFQAPALTVQLGPHDPFGWGEEGRFWTSSANFSFTTPLPYTKGFGREGDANTVNLGFARAAQERTTWNTRSTRNGALNQAMSSYWDMVQAAETVRLLTRTRGAVAARLAAQKRLFDAGLNTQYDVLQIEVELANLTGREELAWDQFLTAGRKLQTLMNAPRGEILIPAPLEDLLDAPLNLKISGDVYDRALSTHPDVRLSDLDYEVSRANLRFRNNQARPDLTFTATASISQNDSAFGYTDPFKSFAALLRPDNANLFFGLRYKIPFGNVPAEAALQRARVEERQAFDRRQQARQTVASSVDDAVSSLMAAQAQLTRADADRALARQAYQRAADMRDQWLVSEFEVLNRFNDTLNADTAWAQARVSVRRAQTRLMSAQGLLEQEMSR